MPIAHLGRHAIHNINGKVIGYELLFQKEELFEKEITSALMSTSKILLNLLTHMDFEKVVGSDRRAFINLDHEILHSGIIGLLRPDKFCLELSPTSEISDRLLATLKKLKKQGFQIALDDFTCEKSLFDRFKPIYHFLRYVKINTSKTAAGSARKYVHMFGEMGIHAISHKIESHDKYRDAINMECKFFQGFHFKKPELIEMEIPMETTRSAILNMVAMVKEDKETEEIEMYAKTQPDLAYNLIKYLNSPSVGPIQPIHSIRQAISMIGRNRLIRWLLIYLYSESAGDDISPHMLRNALSRAERMEKAFANESKSEKEKAFLIGMFSLLDVLFNTPMHIVMRGLPVDQDIVTALTSRTGPYGKALLEIEIEDKKRLLELVNKNFENIHAGDVMRMLETNKVDIGVLAKNEVKKFDE